MSYRSAVWFALAPLLFAPVGARGVPDDSITSQMVREADGTSGQDPNVGSGIKTQHLQDGAVTDAKIAGPISGAKVATEGLNADSVDGIHAYEFAANGHGHDPLYQRRYAHVLVVSRDGRGDFSDPGSALASIQDASAENPFLVKVLPGVYEAATGTIQTKPWVDLEGSGEGVTRLRSTAVAPVLAVAANSEVRGLTVEGRYGVGVAGAGASGISLRDLTVSTTGGSALQDGGATITLRGVTLRVAEPVGTWGIASTGDLKLVDSRLEVTSSTGAAYGLISYGKLQVLRSEIRTDGSQGGVALHVENGTAKIEASAIACSALNNYSTAALEVFGVSKVTVDHSALLPAVNGYFAYVNDIFASSAGSWDVKISYTKVRGVAGGWRNDQTISDVPKTLGAFREASYDPVTCTATICE